MKTKIIILLGLLAINLNLAFANTSFTGTTDKPVQTHPNAEILYLAPVTPVEAYFNDVVPEPVFTISLFAPVTPKEASFDDELNCGTMICNDMLKGLAPVAPKEADFNSSNMDIGNDRNNLSPEPGKETGD